MAYGFIKELNFTNPKMDYFLHWQELLPVLINEEIIPASYFCNIATTHSILNKLFITYWKPLVLQDISVIFLWGYPF